MSRFRGFAVATVAGAVAVAGCGGDGDSGGSTKAGKKLFKDNCGICHSLKDAGSTGTTGPDLDLLKPDRERVKAQIKSGGGAMPPAVVKGKDADAVAAYVAKVAGAAPAGE